MSDPVPTSIARVADPAAAGAVEIGWSDGRRAVFSPRLLRDACPCATCREARAAPPKPHLLPVLAPTEMRPLAITAMTPVGQYAYSIEFSDGHSSGIYTLEYLRELA
ncbi:MAG: gamma-butyrobetaine hydroxylase-like domain-containing protein [Planctomycetaceae bacterium]